LLSDEWKMNEYLIGRLDLPQVMPTLTWLSARLIAALVPQALGRTHKPIGGGRQTAIMVIFALVQESDQVVVASRGDPPGARFPRTDRWLCGRWRCLSQ